MGRLGISLYPEKSSKEDMFRYIDKASECGFSRIFSCLLSAEKSKNEIIAEFKELNGYAKKRGFEIIVDVAPRIFKKLDINYDDLYFFKEIGVDGLRLDEGFRGLEESIMTYNKYGLKIEINMTNNVSYIDTIMDFMPNKDNLIACHNFYPHRYSAMSKEFIEKCTNRFKKYGIRTAAFITSQVENAFGPWPVMEGLPTIENHRDLPIDIQFKEYVSMGTIDDIIISNCYASDEELEKVGSLRRDMVQFDITIYKGVGEIEKSILLDELHFNRGDASENIIRSTQSRVKYKDYKFDIHNAVDIRRGDIIIESSDYGHYSGEMEIAKVDMRNSGKSNVVGRIREEEIYLLDTIKPWQKFMFRKST